MTTPGGDEGHLPPLNVTELRAAVVRPGGLWRDVTVVGETGSTNADLLAAARAGAAEGLVLVAEAQSAGRGRLGRSWVSPPRAALTFSVLLRPAGVPASLSGWLPLLTGVAVAAALRQAAAVDARLKWPNDVLADGAKLGGILAEAWADAVVAGIGLNVHQRRDQLPVAGATSLRLAGSPLAGPQADGRPRLLTAILAELADRYLAWRDQARPGSAVDCGLREEYLRYSATVGRPVTVHLPGEQRITGRAAGVDELGRLAVASASGLVQVSAGDVVHLR